MSVVSLGTSTQNTSRPSELARKSGRHGTNAPCLSGMDRDAIGASLDKSDACVIKSFSNSSRELLVVDEMTAGPKWHRPLCGCRCICRHRPGRLVLCIYCGAGVGPGCCLAAEFLKYRGYGICHLCHGRPQWQELRQRDPSETFVEKEAPRDDVPELLSPSWLVPVAKDQLARDDHSVLEHPIGAQLWPTVRGRDRTRRSEVDHRRSRRHQRSQLGSPEREGEGSHVFAEGEGEEAGCTRV